MLQVDTQRVAEGLSCLQRGGDKHLRWGRQARAGQVRFGLRRPAAESWTQPLPAPVRKLRLREQESGVVVRTKTTIIYVTVLVVVRGKQRVCYVLYSVSELLSEQNLDSLILRPRRGAASPLNAACGKEPGCSGLLAGDKEPICRPPKAHVIPFYSGSIFTYIRCD